VAGRVELVRHFGSDSRARPDHPARHGQAGPGDRITVGTTFSSAIPRQPGRQAALPALHGPSACRGDTSHLASCARFPFTTAGAKDDAITDSHRFRFALARRPAPLAPHPRRPAAPSGRDGLAITFMPCTTATSMPADSGPAPGRRWPSALARASAAAKLVCRRARCSWNIPASSGSRAANSTSELVMRQPHERLPSTMASTRQAKYSGRPCSPEAAPLPVPQPRPTRSRYTGARRRRTSPACSRTRRRHCPAEGSWRGTAPGSVCPRNRAAKTSPASRQGLPRR
jgi:hypothetical protein